MISTATRRYGKHRGSCYLTHGADSYDKQGNKKAQRQLDKAIIAEESDRLHQHKGETDVSTD